MLLAGIYNGISNRKPWNMMNGPGDFALRLVHGLKDAHTEGKKQLVGMGPQNDPFFNPVVGGLYMASAEGALTAYDFTIDIEIRPIPDVPTFSSGTTHTLFFGLKDGTKLDYDAFLRKFQP